MGAALAEAVDSDKPNHRSYQNSAFTQQVLQGTPHAEIVILSPKGPRRRDTLTLLSASLPGGVVWFCRFAVASLLCATLGFVAEVWRRTHNVEGERRAFVFHLRSKPVLP